MHVKLMLYLHVELMHYYQLMHYWNLKNAKNVLSLRICIVRHVTQIVSFIARAKN